MTAAIAAQPATAPAAAAATAPASTPPSEAGSGFAAMVAVALGQLPVACQAAGTPAAPVKPPPGGAPKADDDAAKADDPTGTTPVVDATTLALAAVVAAPVTPPVPVVPSTATGKTAGEGKIAGKVGDAASPAKKTTVASAAGQEPATTATKTQEPVPAPVQPSPAGQDQAQDQNQNQAQSQTPTTTPDPTAAAPTTAPVTAPTTTRPAHVVAGQVIPEVTRLVSRGDGVHRVTLELNPRALGEVRVVLTLRHGDVHVRLAAGSEARVALAQSSGELSRALEQLGIKDHRISLAALPGDTGVNAGLNDQSRQAQPDTTNDQSRQQNPAGGFHAEQQQQDHHSWKGADSLATDGALTHQTTGPTTVPVSISSPTGPALAGSVDVRM